MDMQLQDKTVIVTAGSKGLGKAIATAFAEERAVVYISSRNETNLKQAVKEIKQKTGNNSVSYVVCDMKDPQAIKQMIHSILDQRKTIDVLINNAGGPPAGSFLEMNDEYWYHAFELNLLSFIRTIRAVVPQMQQQQAGHIVNVASSSIKQALDNLVLSNTMRPGIVGLSKTLAQELSQDNILINTVGPGSVKTDRILDLNRKQAGKLGVSEEEVMNKAEAQIPMKRYGRPEEFAKAILFLASASNTYITGQSLIVDGGLIKSL
ncbi:MULTISPECIES: SDR family oxidoreductase [Virgibacillus]|uniref:3-oxoacyl-[acyl-carrier-protein] reductase FabG n=1 Tax=Virgibacillus massiliensis TaxID=1462526 RepID=A0A024Q8T9_9BACI|nr:SDR family oxidoreductase [Virgibacillus massiliensis]CDQ38899.1 3-oxoacyl-[acyl-carrier-protein] reductase FabG [Virgibacillus massiliensis]